MVQQILIINAEAGDIYHLLSLAPCVSAFVTTKQTHPPRDSRCTHSIM